MDKTNSTGDIIFQLYCQFCGDCFRSFFSLDEHIKTYHGNNEEHEISISNEKLTKDMSDRLEPDAGNLTSEMVEKLQTVSSSCEKKVIHKCQFCDETFYDRRDFEVHIESGHDPFEETNAAVVIRVIRVDQNAYMCSICSKVFTTSNRVVQHTRSRHKGDLQSTIELSEKGLYVIKCDICHREFKTKRELTIHKDIHGREVLFACPYCSVKTTALNDTVKHVKNVHASKSCELVKPLIIRIENSKPCTTKDISHEKVISDDQLISEDMHIISNVPKKKQVAERANKVYKCPHCSLLTHYSEALKRHLQRIHHAIIQPEDLENMKDYLLDEVDITPDIVKSIKKNDSKDLELNKLSSYFQCPFCVYKCTHKSNMRRHLNSNKHRKEVKRGSILKLKIADLEVSNAVDTEHVEAQHKKCSLKSGNTAKGQQSFNTKIGSASGPGREHDQDCLQAMYETPSQPVVKLQRIKSPIKVPKEEFKSDMQVSGDEPEFDYKKTYRNMGTVKPVHDISAQLGSLKAVSECQSGKNKVQNQHRNKPMLTRSKIKELDKVETNKSIAKGNTCKCPHCGFQCKRQSALRFHIRFNHGDDKSSKSGKSTRKKYENQIEDTFSISKIAKTTANNQKLEPSTSTILKSPVKVIQPPLRTKVKKRSFEEKDIEVSETVRSTIKRFRTGINIDTKKNKENKNKEYKNILITDKEIFISENESRKSDQQQRVEKCLLVNNDLNEYTCNHTANNHDSMIEKDNTRNEVSGHDKMLQNELDTGNNDDANLKDGHENEQDDDSEGILYLCPFCNARFKWLKSVKRHITGSHPNEQLSSVQIETVVEEYEGPSTEPMQRKAKNLLTHCFKCPYCEIYSHCMKTIQQHVEFLHKDMNFKEEAVEIIDTGKVPFKEYDGISYNCPFCENEFKWLNITKKHISAVHPKENLSVAKVYVQVDSEREESLQENKIETESAEEILYKCPYCEQVVRWLKSMKQHIQTMHPDKPYIQDDIKIGAGEQVSVEDGSKDNALGSLFGCPRCNLKFRLLKSALHHVATFHSGNEPETNQDKEDGKKAEDHNMQLYKCPFCEKHVEWMKNMKKHIEKNHRDKTFKKADILLVNKGNAKNGGGLQRFQCPFCPLQLQWKNSILRHVAKFHQSRSSTMTSDDIKPVSEEVTLERYFCPYCPLQFRWKHSVARHVGRFHQEKIDDFSVDQIESKVVDAPPLFMNEEEFIGDEGIDNIEDDGDDTVLKDGSIKLTVNESELGDGKKNKTHCCIRCTRMFNSYASLWKHNMMYHNLRGKPYKCRTCQKAFVFQHQRDRHEEKHSSEKHHVYCCDQDGCPKRYTEKKALYRHLKTKHGEKNPAARLSVKKEKKVYCCEKCKIVFKNPSSYWRHNLRLHQGTEKQHECKICTKTFFFAHELKDHMFVHIHKADLPCPMAGCVFKTKKLRYLSYHMNNQHGVKVDSKSLGKHVLSQEQITPEELLDLFPLGKVQEEPKISESVGVEEQVDPVEPDMQIVLLETGASSLPDPGSESVPASSSGETQLPNMEVTTDFINTEIGDQPKPDSEGESGTVDGLLDSQKAELAGVLYKCKACQKAFTTHRQLIKHKVSDHPEDLTVYKCDQCSKSFFTNYDLNDHKAYSHPTSKDHVCEFCGKRFPILRVLQKHRLRHKETPMKVESKQGEVMCDLCGLSLRFKASLKTHMHRAHPEKMKCSCNICSTHDDGQAITDIKAPFCNLCNRYFCKKAFLEAHMRAVHNTTGRHTCNFCPEKFSTLSQKNMHMHQMHTIVKEPAATEEADMGQISTLNDDTHIIEISNDDQSGPKFLPKLSEQGMKAVTKELKIYTEEGKKHWKCLLCGQCFSKVKYFNLHVRRTHVRPEHQPYRCKICSAGFVRVGEFRKHTRSHSGFRPLKCKICHKSFKQQAHLKEHSLIHTDTRQYKCEICQGRFKQRGALLAHVVKHDKLKPYKCQFCGVGFTVRGALSKHMKKYFGNDDTDSYLCHICHKTFSHFPLLLKHIQSHQEPNPFICDTCDKAFAAFSSLYFHKVKEKHFKEQEYEAATPKKVKKKGTEVNIAVNPLVLDEEKPDPVTKSLHMESVGSENEKETSLASGDVVEVTVEESREEEGTTAFEVEGHTDEELLAIAKQLTEMSSYPGNEVFIEDVEENARNDEEEKIMINMLDADDEIKSNLERNLLLSKSESLSEQMETNANMPENTYVQILQYVDENGVPIEHVDENGVPIQHVIEDGVPIEQIVESGITIHHVDETTIQTEHSQESKISNEQVNETGATLETVSGGLIPVQEIDNSNVQSEHVDKSDVFVKHMGGIEVKVHHRNESHASVEAAVGNIMPVKHEDENSVLIDNVDDSDVSAQHTDENSVHIQYVDEKGVPVEYIGENSILIQHGDKNNDTAVNVEEIDIPVYHTDENGAHVHYVEEHAIPREPVKNNSTITESQIIEEGREEAVTEYLEENLGVEILRQTQETDGPKTRLLLHAEMTQAPEQEKIGSDKHIVVINSSAEEIHEGQTVDSSETQAFSEKSNNSSAFIITRLQQKELNVLQDETKVADGETVIAGTQLGEIIPGSGHAVQSGQLTIAEQEQYIANETNFSTSQTYLAKEIDPAGQFVAGDELFEPPVMPASLVKIQNNSQGSIIEQQQIEKIESVDSHNLTPLGISELIPTAQVADGTAPVFVMKKTDGSLVYICVSQEKESATEVLGAALRANVDFEELELKDERLESAEILKSIAESSSAGHEQTQETLTAGDEQGIQIHVYDRPALSGKRRLVKLENSSEQIFVYECSICQSLLKTKKNLRDHYQRHTNKEDRPFECTLCSKRFVTKSELGRHERIHSNDRPWECNVCGKKFKQPGHLLTHKRLHTGEKPYACSQCDAKFTTSSLLKSHIVTHSDERNFQCNICKTAFKTIKDLRRHRAVHSGIVGNKLKTGLKTTTVSEQEDSKKHICHLCGKTFNRKLMLEQHIAAEENLRPFKCSECGLGFNLKSGLRIHSFRHKDVKPEICSVCGKAFKRVASLKLHMKIHLHDEKDTDGKLIKSAFPCPACNKQFNHRGALYYHIGVSPDCMAKGSAKIEPSDEDMITEGNNESLSVEIGPDTQDEALSTPVKEESLSAGVVNHEEI